MYVNFYLSYLWNYFPLKIIDCCIVTTEQDSVAWIMLCLLFYLIARIFMNLREIAILREKSSFATEL